MGYHIAVFNHPSWNFRVAHKPAALGDGATDDIDSFLAPFEKEQRRVAVIARLQRYLLSFEHAQA